MPMYISINFLLHNIHAHPFTTHSSLLMAVEAHYKDPTNPYPGEDNAMLYELTPYLESAGLSDPLTKVCPV